MRVSWLLLYNVQYTKLKDFRFFLYKETENVQHFLRSMKDHQKLSIIAENFRSIFLETGFNLYSSF